MAHFVKTGFWAKAKIGLKGWLDLDELIRQVAGGGTFSSITGAPSDNTLLAANLDAKLDVVNTPVALVNAPTMDLTSINQTLSTSEATRTFTISSLSDDITLAVILNTTDATYTFPAGSLTVSEGVASGDNLLVLSGVSGDTYVIGVKKIGSIYYVVSKNFGQ